MISLLFVCLGNICRSPALMGYMNHLVLEKKVSGQVYIDSCGLHSNFLGASPDQRMQSIGKQKGIFFKNQAKIFQPFFFETFQLIFGVSEEIVSSLFSLTHKKEEQEKIHHVTEYSLSYKGIDIPDPYHFGNQGFKKVWEMIEDSCQGIYQECILKHLSDA